MKIGKALILLVASGVVSLATGYYFGYQEGVKNEQLSQIKSTVNSAIENLKQASSTVRTKDDYSLNAFAPFSDSLALSISESIKSCNAGEELCNQLREQATHLLPILKERCEEGINKACLAHELISGAVRG